MIGRLILEDGTEFEGESFGFEKSTAGEVVFSTGMVGYPESFTDPSFLGEILILTYPLIGNYGVPPNAFFESDGIKISGLIVSDYINTPSHPQSEMTLADWLKKEKVPALIIKDTRFLTQKIREKGTMLGKIVIDKEIELYDPNKENLVAKVSTKKVRVEGEGKKTVILFDCGVKRNIVKSFLKRGVKVIVVPWDFDLFHKETLSSHLTSGNVDFDAIAISNGPGDPKMADKTIATVKKALERKIPIFGICLGNQILALAAGGDTYKLKFGHRSQNQPCVMEGSDRCYITMQNHGFAVGKIPAGFKPWFTNANDGSNEGIIHEKLPFMSVQFHPEANPGPKDTEWIFDYFLERIKK
ncbi:MAG: glutamine-hydrolyzing carbamoyl-phosphate synthase small subunit [bacterium]|nr:glutamine-hydrolyzing carbamoyl-phosphate synthase small subunit [bacterium]